MLIMNTQQSKALNKLHYHKGKKTQDGYGICQLCGSVENTDGYSGKCLGEGYYLFSNPSVGIDEKSKIYFEVDSSGQKWIDWCEPSISATKIEELLPGFVLDPA
jgi:hypothetical protein